MHDTIIYRVDILVKYQPELFVFTNCKGWLIGYGDVDTTGVDGDGDGDGDGDENEAPLQIENENDLEYQEDQEEIHP